MPNCSPPNYPGSPPYAPDFIASSVSCAMSKHQELRGRAPVGLGGTFFRTKGTGTGQNNLSIEMIYDGGNDYYTLIVRDDGVEVETFGGGSPEVYPKQGTPSGDPETCSPNLIDNFRADVNANSAYIEMPTIDYGGEAASAGELPIFEPGDDAGCLSPFAEINFSNGDGGPTVGPSSPGSPPETQPRTGPERTLYVIILTEVITGTAADDGQSYDPLSTDKIKQWNGTAWISYQPNVCV